MGNFLFNFLDWDSDFYSFFRNVKDMYPYQIIRKEGKTIIIFNALGVDKKDITVDLEKSRGTDYLVIRGKTDDPIGGTYSVNGRFVVDSNEIKNIECECKNGLLFITINWKQPEKPKIDIVFK